ncbi:MAG TPA: glutamine amidotransferase, partial [Pirellulaceae bacterium]|nr:glutamine amidotransferase [Pirellulaceae bacterium]
MTDWSFAPIFDSYALVATVVGALALLALIGPNFGHTSKPRRWTLVALRWLIVALFSLALLRPTCVHTTTRMQRSSLLILVDQSRSMQLPHATGDQSRWEAQKRAFQAAQTVLGEMADRIDVKWFAYDERLQTLEGTGGFPTLADKPGGAQTDIGSSLSAAVRQELGKRLAGVIVSGDGVQTAYEPSVELHDAARELERLGYPLYTLVFGPPGSAAQSRDVALESLPDQYTVFVKNELAVRGVVRVHGYVNQEVPVELVIEDASGKQRKLGARQVVAREDGQQLEAAFSFTPDEVGRYKLTMSAAVQPGELVTKNNQLTSYLTVLEGGLKILYLDGKLLHEQRFLSRALDSSPDMSLDFQWFDSRQRDKWPVTLNQPLDASQYDVFILGDLDSSALGERNLSQLARAVQRGKGLIMLGGQHSFGPGGYQNSPLADVLPIKIDRLERQDFGQPPRADLHLSGALAMLPARDHPVLRLAPPAENAGRWQSLPPLDGANKFVDLKDAPGVQLLAETPKHEPLLVAGEYGQGRVLAFAGDSTWR